MARRISAAREHGDLKENAEYHAAKEDQAHLETRIARLNQRLRNARVVEAPAGDADTVAFGATVHVVDEESGRASTFTLVGPTEADLKAGKLSSESPMAVALMGESAGEVAVVETPAASSAGGSSGSGRRRRRSLAATPPPGAASYPPSRPVHQLPELARLHRLVPPLDRAIAPDQGP